MTRRLPRLLFAALTLNAALLAGSLTAPTVTVACSCATEFGRPFTEVAEFVGDPRFVIVSGTVAGVQPGLGHTEQLGRFLVDRMFQGSVPTSQVVVVGGDSAACKIRLEDGMQFMGVATIENDTLNPSWCFPYGDLRYDGGKAILVEVRSLLGEGVGVDEPEPTSDVLAQVVVPGGFSPLAVFAVIGLIAVVVMLVIFPAAERRERREPKG